MASATMECDFFSILPNEVLCLIFYHIRPFQQLLSVTSVICRRWRQIIFNEQFTNEYYKIKYRQLNLIGWWNFNNSESVGYDSSGLIGRKYTINGTPWIDQCFLGNCAVFDGHSSIQVPVMNYQQYQIEFYSISLWVNFDSIDYVGRNVFLAAWQDDLDKNWIHLACQRNYIQSQVMIFNLFRCQYDCIAHNAHIDQGTWYHIVVRVSHQKQELWINGELSGVKEMINPRGGTVIFRSPNEGTCSQLKMSMPNVLTIGAKNKLYEDSWYGGRLADISIWNCWLETKEIRAISQQKCSVGQMKIGTYLFLNLCNTSLMS
ncbi:unnamed protein product [Didymodactylos carnosus]|uniref:F-box domain-containing protein n=1 Tax=Didymodactylos carnosus TaxID=1234261 RepID=A0A815SU61_9BILA|nr:unnamed protein product [Didymodactylos carnosus]CAF4359646.1 unnamed protein product [Didymodactylos carnosus]